MKIILFVFFILIFSITNIPFLRSQQLTQDEFENQLMKACLQSNDQIVLSLIRDHRLMVKSFVDKCISESIQMELEGEVGKSQQKQSLAEKTASTFNDIHSEKSLVIAVNNLKNWSKPEKEQKFKADSLSSLGTSLRSNREKSEEAIMYYQEAIEIYKKIGDEYGQAVVLGGLGYIYYFIDAETTLSYYQKALEVREKIDDKQLMGASLNGIGLVYSRFIGDYEQAIEYFDKAGDVRTEIGDWSSLGSTLSYKASAYEKMGQFELAVKYFEQSFEINKKTGNQLRMAEAMLKSGTNLHQTGKYPEALEDLETAIEIYRNLEDTIGTGDVLTQMGFVYSMLGDYNTAIEKCTEALKLMKEVNDLLGMAGVYNNMGIILQSAGRPERASEYYENSLEKYEELDDKQGVLGILNNLGTVSFDLGDFEKAEEYHYRGLQLSRELKSKILEVHCLLNMANDQNRLGKLDEALSNYESGLQIARSLNSPETVWKTMVGMAENYKLKGEYAKAIEYNEKGLAIIEEMRSSMQSEEFKANYMARERYAFEDVINMLGELHEKDSESGYDIKAFQFAEQSKSRALLDLLTESIANVYEGADQELLAEQDEILTRLNLAKQQLEAESAYDNADDQIINSLKEDIKSKEEELNAIKIKIRSTNPRYAELQYPQPVSINELQTSCLDKNTLLLEYSLGDSSSYLWVITREDHQLFKLPDRKALKEQIETLRFALLNPNQRNTGFFTQSGFSLYRQLIQPAEQYFSKKSKLVIIPDGILNYLPFEVLITEEQQENTEGSYSDLPYLVKKYPISYGQSSSVLKSLIEEQKRAGTAGKSSKKLIAFGDPVYEKKDNVSFITREGLDRLEHSGIEVEKIASLFPDGHSNTYLREAATEENVKREGELAKFSYIHFATHGLIDELKPDYSSLALTREENSVEDGFLQAAEIFNLNMDADLVVLSACQTGLGKMVRGEGMVGLTRAFMYAGTPSVLVSLWSVSDVSTASLMEKFYSHLIVGKLTKTEALQKAQLSLIKEEQYAHPFYWAPFVLIGNWK